MDEHNVYVEIRKLPSFSKLNKKVREMEEHATWWERYGMEWGHVGCGVGAGVTGLLLLRTGTVLDTAVGFILLGFCHSILTQKAGHLATHGAMATSGAWNKFWSVMFVEFCGGYSEHMGRDIHVKCHHPHTNIIGLGDSSSWKVPAIPRVPYMFLMPTILPVLAPLIALQQLVEAGAYWPMVRFVPVVVLGIVCRVALFVYCSGYTVLQAVLSFWLYQAVFSVPYIHINIFQHIGLPMYSAESRPARIYQMSTGVLNLCRNPILDAAFGHSLTNSHVEHHLFPRLSDNMCLRVKGLVREYLLSHHLPYHEQSYLDRMREFLHRYDELMVKAPPITHFVGIQ